MNPVPLYYVCVNCWHTMAHYEIADDECPACHNGTMKEIARLNIPAPHSGANMECLVCGQYRPWGIFSPQTGITVCVQCRDRARASVGSASEAPPKKPDMYADAEDGENAWSDLKDYAESVDAGEVLEIVPWFAGKPFWIAHVVKTRDEAGEPDETEIQRFATRDEARAAVDRAVAP